MRKINKHIIHCSDSTFGDVARIREWHMAKGWRDIGYHFIIRRDGEIETGRLLSEIGAHCKGYNAHSIGTCLIGKNKFTIKQFNTLRRLHKGLVVMFPKLLINGHRDFNSYKTCPNFEIDEILEE